MSNDDVETMIVAGTCGGRSSNTLRQYTQGFKTFIEVANEMDWKDFPYIHGTDVENDLVRLSIFINVQQRKGVSKRTVSNYVSGIKFSLSRYGICSEALGAGKKWHPWIKNSIEAMTTVTESNRREYCVDGIILSLHHKRSLIIMDFQQNSYVKD